MGICFNPINYIVLRVAKFLGDRHWIALTN